jgi:NAD-dependent DNA ligase
LDYLREVFGLKCSGPHTAQGDVESVVDLLSRVVFPRLTKAGLEDIVSIAEFSGLKPLSKCRARIQPFEIGVVYKDIPYVNPNAQANSDKRAINKQREQEQEAERHLNESIHNILASATSYPKLLLDYRLLEETPDVCFKDETFLFTGKMAWGPRSKAEKEIILRGGKMCKKNGSTKDVDYLVLGEDPEKGWLTGDRRSKLADAFYMKIARPWTGLKIIREEDFLAAL